MAATFWFALLLACIGMFRAEPREVRLLLACLVGASGLYIVALNYVALWQGIFRQKHSSMIPLIGGLLIALATTALFPRGAWFASVPLLLDPAGVMLVAAALIRWRRTTR